MALNPGLIPRETSPVSSEGSPQTRRRGPKPQDGAVLSPPILEPLLTTTGCRVSCQGQGISTLRCRRRPSSRSIRYYTSRVGRLYFLPEPTAESLPKSPRRCSHRPPQICCRETTSTMPTPLPAFWCPSESSRGLHVHLWANRRRWAG
jgi:hypothetical protein